MTDRIEKIVSKWGFKRNDDGNTPRFERWYRHFFFSIEIKPDYFEIYAIGKDEDNNPCQYRRTEFKRDFIYLDDGSIDIWKLERVIKYSIREFLDNFFKHDLFHDKDWKDGN